MEKIMERIKHTFCSIVVVAVFVVLLFICSLIERTDIKKGIVIKVNKYNVIVEDTMNVKWYYSIDKDNKQFNLNDNVKMYIDNKGTIENGLDDIVWIMKKEG